MSIEIKVDRTGFDCQLHDIQDYVERARLLRHIISKIYLYRNWSSIFVCGYFG
jgi:hypothetical protein